MLINPSIFWDSLSSIYKSQDLERAVWWSVSCASLSACCLLLETKFIETNLLSGNYQVHSYNHSLRFLTFNEDFYFSDDCILLYSSTVLSQWESLINLSSPFISSKEIEFYQSSFSDDDIPVTWQDNFILTFFDTSFFPHFKSYLLTKRSF